MVQQRFLETGGTGGQTVTKEPMIDLSRRLADQVAIVTGGAQGIGRAIAMRLGAEGASVAVLDVNERGTQDTVAALMAEGKSAIGLVCNVTRREQVQERHHAIFDVVAEGRGSVRGPFAILMHSPVLCRRHLDVGTFLRFNSGLEADARELAIIATAREKDCPYIWAAHAPAARQAGLSRAIVSASRFGRRRTQRGASVQFCRTVR